MDRRRILGLAVVLLLVALGGCAQPVADPVCGICAGGERVTDAGEGEYEPYWNGFTNVSEERSTVHIHLRRDGGARWVVRVRLSGASLDRLRSRSDLGNWVAETRSDDTPADPVAGVDARFRGNTMVVSYETRDLARRGVGGTLLVDGFFETDSVLGWLPAYRLNADRVVVHAPPGMVVTNDPAGARRVNRTAVAWVAGSEEHGSVAPHTYLAFGPDDGVGGRVAAEVSVATAVAGWAAGPLAWAVVVPLVSVLVIVGIVVVGAPGTAIEVSGAAAGDDRERWDEESRSLSDRLPSVSLNRDAIRPPWELAVGLAATLAFALLAAWSFGWRLLAWIAFYLPVVPLAVLAVLGPLADLSPRVRRVLVGVLLGSPVVAAIPPVLSFGGGGIVLAAVWVVGILGVGTPILGTGWIGTRMVRERT